MIKPSNNFLKNQASFWQQFKKYSSPCALVAPNAMSYISNCLKPRGELCFPWEGIP